MPVIPPSSLRRTGLTIVAAATALLMSLTTSIRADAAAPTSASPRSTTKSSSSITWSACNDGFFCGELTVPLDYDHPGGAQISVAVVKLAASDQAHRIGSVFVNPGGPGGSGVDFVLGAGPDLFTPEVRARFDIVGFDPRGIIRSNPLRCFATQADADATRVQVVYPNSKSAKRVWIAAERAVDHACAERGRPILNHMSTADTARDLDRLRQAVGDRYLTYYGVSYGSFLGNVYANLFPNRFRALVIDGVLDPVAWTTGRGGQGRRVPFSTRLRSDVGAQDTLNAFFRLCDAHPENCAFGPRSAKRYADLYRSLKRHPLPMTFQGSTVSYDESFLVGESLGAMYDSSSWPMFADRLAELEQMTQSTASTQRTRLLVPFADDYLNFVEGFPGVACSDSVNPHSYQAWSRAAKASHRQNGYFGPIWTWASSICAEWPGRDADRYLGPFSHRTRKPVLVVGNLYDPATPYQGAVTASRLLPNSSLLTLKAWGHTSLFRSTCADQAIARYLLTSQPPAPGSVCRQDVTPFAQPAAATRTLRKVTPASAGPRRPHW